MCVEQNQPYVCHGTREWTEKEREREKFELAAIFIEIAFV